MVAQGDAQTVIDAMPWNDYAVGARIDHVDAMTIEDAAHMLATRLYENTAKVHFKQHVERAARFGKRIVYGGHIISLASAVVQQPGRRAVHRRQPWRASHPRPASAATPFIPGRR